MIQKFCVATGTGTVYGRTRARIYRGVGVLWVFFSTLSRILGIVTRFESAEPGADADCDGSTNIDENLL
jgi:hypothetical protein